MSKSLFKNKYIIENKIKVKERGLLIYSFFLKKKLEIYNGRNFILKYFKDSLAMGLPFGGFALTRKIGKIHEKKNKNKKLKKK